MTAVLETTTVTFPNGSELVGMLTDLALLCAKEPSHRPMLTAMRLHTSGGQLHGWATNSFQAGHAATPAEGELPGPVCLHASGVKQVSTAFKAWRHALTVTVNYELGIATFTDGTTGLTVGLMRLEGMEYPNIPATLTHTLSTSEASVSFLPVALEVFVKIAKRRDPREQMVLAVGRTTQVRIGDSFRGWLMAGRREPLPESDWLPASF